MDAGCAQHKLYRGALNRHYREMQAFAEMKIIEPVTIGEFERYYKLRWKILRAPWKQARGSERVDDDADSTHLMVMDETIS